MNGEIIAVDVDDVVLDLVGTLVKHYNKEWDDSLRVEDIKTWEISQYVKPDCGKKVHKYFEDPNMYIDMPVLPNAIEGIKFLKLLGYRVVYVTHSTMGASGAKYKRLLELGLLDSQNDYAEVKDKSLIRSSYLIDDNPENIRNFKGTAIAFTMPWNKNETFPFRVRDWKEVVNLFQIMEKQKVRA